MSVAIVLSDLVRLLGWRLFNECFDDMECLFKIYDIVRESLKHGEGDEDGESE